MKAIVYQPGRGAVLSEVPEPQIGPEEALISVDACGLCGSDLLKLVDPQITGAILGHEVAGRIARLGAKVKNFKAGDRVIVAHHVPCLECHFCRRGHPSMCAHFRATNIAPGGFSEMLSVSAKHLEHTVLKIPETMDAFSATFTEPLACCLRNIKRIRVAEGDTVGIVGLGSIGLLTGQLLKHFKAAVVGFDLDARRVAVAREMGFIVPDGDNAKQTIFRITEGRGLDSLIFTAGGPELAAERLSWLRGGGTLSVFAEFARQQAGRAIAQLDLNEIYHRELTITSSYSPSLEDLREALSLIAAKKIDLSRLTDQRFSLADFDRAVRLTKSREVLKAILVPA